MWRRASQDWEPRRDGYVGAELLLDQVPRENGFQVVGRHRLFRSGMQRRGQWLGKIVEELHGPIVGAEGIEHDLHSSLIKGLLAQSKSPGT